jgi:osmotically-inducible protein OsmY
MPVEGKQESPLPHGVAAVAEARFRAHSYTALRSISCKADQGVLVLEGRLSSFFQKQLAQEIAANVEGVVQVINQIEVVILDWSRRR